VADLKKDFRAGARALRASSSTQRRDTVEIKPTSKTILQMRALSKTGKKLKAAKKEYNEQILVYAQRQCLPICEKIFTILPHELRIMMYQYLITDKNATFYDGRRGSIMIANGCSALQHRFDVGFTGPNMHMEMIEELNHREVRFDFRRRHELLGRVFAQYKSVYGFDIASKITNVGLVLNSADITGREKAFECFNELFKLSKGAHIHVFIESPGKTQMHISRSFRRVARVFVPFLARLKQTGYKVTVVMNPSYILSTVKNSMNSSFSLIHEQGFRYSFTLEEAEFSTTGIERKLERVSGVRASLSTQLINSSTLLLMVIN
jgi:hypothetical protein